MKPGEIHVWLRSPKLPDISISVELHHYCGTSQTSCDVRDVFGFVL